MISLNILISQQHYSQMIRSASRLLRTHLILLNQDIESLVKWSSEWNLMFNPSKTVQLSFKSNESTTYTIEISSITKVANHYDLGVILSSDLLWEPHYQHNIILPPRLTRW